MYKPIGELLIPVTEEDEIKEDDDVQNEAIVAGVGQIDGVSLPDWIKKNIGMKYKLWIIFLLDGISQKWCFFKIKVPLPQNYFSLI